MMVIEENVASDRPKAGPTESSAKSGEKGTQKTIQQTSDDLTSIVRPEKLPMSTLQRRM